MKATTGDCNKYRCERKLEIKNVQNVMSAR